MQLQWCVMKYTLVSTGEFSTLLTHWQLNTCKRVGGCTNHASQRYFSANHESRETMDANTSLDTVWRTTMAKRSTKITLTGHNTCVNFNYIVYINLYLMWSIVWLVFTTKFEDIKDGKTRKQCCVCHSLFIFNKSLFRSKEVHLSRKSAKKIMYCTLVKSHKSCITWQCPVLHRTANLGPTSVQLQVLVPSYVTERLCHLQINVQMWHLALVQ